MAFFPKKIRCRIGGNYGLFLQIPRITRESIPFLYKFPTKIGGITVRSTFELVGPLARNAPRTSVIRTFRRKK